MGVVLSAGNGAFYVFLKLWVGWVSEIRDG